MSRASRVPAIHYAGYLRWKTTGGATVTVTAGFAACVAGHQAEKIASDGRNTEDTSKVTCRRCLANMALARASAEEERRVRSLN
jgi:hypothetical protein